MVHYSIQNQKSILHITSTEIQDIARSPAAPMKSHFQI